MKVPEFVEKLHKKLLWIEADGWNMAEFKQALSIVEAQREALDWIHGACGDARPCKCGRPTGVLALKSHARRALDMDV